MEGPLMSTTVAVSIRPPPTCNEQLIALIDTVGVCMMGWNLERRAEALAVRMYECIERQRMMRVTIS